MIFVKDLSELGLCRVFRSRCGQARFHRRQAAPKDALREAQTVGEPTKNYKID